MTATADTPRQRIRLLLVHIAHRVALLDRLEQQRTQIVIIIGALIQALDDPWKAPDAALEQLLNSVRDAADVKLIVTPFLAAFVTEDQRAFQEFADLLTAALMLERSSFGAGAARRRRYNAGAAEISAVAQLGPMIEQADRAGRYSGLRQESPAAVNFWKALEATEQEALMSVASRQKFAAGAVLMEEGDKADHVIIILDGWTKICVHDNGGERVIAQRGPGQLVGERGAFQINVRSASVIALEVVEALVVKTDEFAVFVSAHPNVLDILDRQVYDRLTEAPRTADGGNCTVLLIDVVGFGARSRNDQDRRIIREALWNMTRTALEPLWNMSAKQDRGDGLLLIVPPGIPAAKVMERLSSELALKLRRHNASHADSARIQLRVAVCDGPIATGTTGITGEAIILAARMLDAPVLKETMAGSGADIGVMASAFVHEAVIEQGADLSGLGSFARVEVDFKGSHISAWMWC